MMAQPIVGTLIGIALLLLLILRLKIPAFLALLIGSIAAGLIAGQSAEGVLASMREGMGGTLGFVATVVGLGALFGAVLEKAGGAQSIARLLLRRFGMQGAPLAMVLSGFVIAIPVFFDVAFIILMPMVYALQRRSGRSLLLYAIPLLAGLAATHAFIPPTPGPIAVAEIVGADLGWVILLGLIAGLPSVLVAGLWFGRRIAARIPLQVPEEWAQLEEEETPAALPSAGMVLAIVGLPIFLILSATLGSQMGEEGSRAAAVLRFLGHPFVALLIANLIAWYWLGIRRGYRAEELLKVSGKAMGPAGTIILLTGAGGVFKQVLVDTEAGAIIAEGLSGAGLPVIVFAFLASALVRIAQGSATVAMITGASLSAPLLDTAGLSSGQLAAVVLAIASGATLLSHVNDSGFWLVKQYLGMDERQTFRSWTVMTVLLGLTGFALSGLLFVLL